MRGQAIDAEGCGSGPSRRVTEGRVRREMTTAPRLPLGHGRVAFTHISELQSRRPATVTEPPVPSSFRQAAAAFVPTAGVFSDARARTLAPAATAAGAFPDPPCRHPIDQGVATTAGIRRFRYRMPLPSPTTECCLQGLTASTARQAACRARQQAPSGLRSRSGSLRPGLGCAHQVAWGLCDERHM
jgi:hypothetical protein